MIKSVLLATDGSEHAGRAQRMAIELAQKFSARLIILHVLPKDLSANQLRRIAETGEFNTPIETEFDRLGSLSPAPAMLGGAFIAPSVARSTVEALGREIVERADHDASNHGIQEISLAIEAGDPSERIVERAARDNADLIVMGRRGLGQVKELFIGSVSHKVSQLAKCPCLTVA
jgi:nucleotide-binding universal stress UspA family protein